MKKAGSDHEAHIRKLSLQLGPALSKATIFFHETVSGKLGLNASDTKCMGLVMNSQQPVTAGDLAIFTGLTTGAVTGIIDRLEKAKLIERTRDPQDRRKVFLVPNKAGVRTLLPLYSSLQKSVEKLAASYTAAQLELITGYLEKSIALMENETQKLRER